MHRSLVERAKYFNGFLEQERSRSACGASPTHCLGAPGSEQHRREGRSRERCSKEQFSRDAHEGEFNIESNAAAIEFESISGGRSDVIIVDSSSKSEYKMVMPVDVDSRSDASVTTAADCTISSSAMRATPMPTGTMGTTTVRSSSALISTRTCRSWPAPTKSTPTAKALSA